MSVDVLEHLWEGLTHQWFPLGGHGGYDNFFVPWPGLRLVQGLSKALSAKEPHGEAEGGTGSQFGCSFWAPFWVPVQSLDILHILGRGRGFPQLIHTQKCWDEKRDRILFPLQARRATVLHLTHRKGWDKEGTLKLPHPWRAQPWILQASAICQGKGTTHTLLLLLSWCRPDFKYSLNLLNRKIQTVSDIPFLENHFGKYDSFTSLLNRRSNIFQHSLRMHLTRS